MGLHVSCLKVLGGCLSSVLQYSVGCLSSVLQYSVGCLSSSVLQYSHEECQMFKLRFVKLLN
ncbi:unnamed protein product [Ranitomeya imitator]|uniref:Uncharacterized protein n=1 Tax=Ranitomeya imitator TaxID=111125 RepID=A0ABN9M402_9NEOB|nr:unnamed protein product [Ranitomeya imitator]